MDVVAAFDGVVTTYGHDDYYGDYLIIAHAGGVSTVYSHLMSVTVGPGATVSQGDVIGSTGAMVDDLGAHLEFRVFVDGEKVDAEPYIKTYNGAPLFTD